MIKNIIFDLSEVIIFGYYGTENLVEKKYKITAKEFLAQREIYKDLFLEAMRGNGTEEAYFAELVKETNWEITLEELKSIIRENLNRQIEGTMEIIQKLKGKYQLILLSDHIKEWADYIVETNQSLQIFDSIFFSYELGKLKSDAGTFQFVLEKLKVNPSETVFIDDYEKNIDMAKAQGIHGILFQNANQLQAELKEKYGIKIEE